MKYPWVVLAAAALAASPVAQGGVRPGRRFNFVDRPKQSPHPEKNPGAEEQRERDRKGKDDVDRENLPGREEIRYPVDKAGFLKEWLLLGPFAVDGDPSSFPGIRTQYPPEAEGVDTAKSYPTAAGKSVWKRVISDNDIIDLRGQFQPSDKAVAFAACWVISSDKNSRKAILAIGSGDGCKIWWNGEPVITALEMRPAAPRQNAAVVTVNPGANLILVKVENGFGEWGFMAELADERGESPLGMVGFTTTPPEKGAGSGNPPAAGAGPKDDLERKVEALGKNVQALREDLDGVKEILAELDRLGGESSGELKK